jgi:hypothetical protein
MGSSLSRSLEKAMSRNYKITAILESTEDISSNIHLLANVKVLFMNLPNHIVCCKVLVDRARELLGKDIPVLVFAGNDLEINKKACESNNVIVFLKPLDLEEINSAILSLL